MALVSRLLVLGNVTNGIRLVSQATGYGTVIGLSVLFAIIILAATRAQKRYLAEDSGKSEMFMVANRSVGTGLTASAMFSSWMWINETVFSAVSASQSLFRLKSGDLSEKLPNLGVSQTQKFPKGSISSYVYKHKKC